MTDTVVAEGQVKFRDGKKVNSAFFSFLTFAAVLLRELFLVTDGVLQTSVQWKTRWVVLQKPSPVADCLILLVYKKKKRRRNSRRKEKLSVTLEGICGVEPGPGFDGVSYTLSILCLAHTQVLGFSSWDALLAWDTNIRYSLGEVHRFCVSVGAGTKLESGPASLHLCNNLLVLSRGPPHTVIGHWKLSALRRYGAVPHGFVFEGGTRCGLSDPGSDPLLAEERLSLETSELEKRLSMLSQCSLTSSTASAYSCSSSVAGDDHSLSSSSSCQSDASYGRRLACWVEPSVRPHLSGEMAASSSTLKALTRSDDRLYDGMTGGRLAYAQLHPRCLHDSGRQSSLDSGIGIATGSQSSYCGSYSSRTGSLEIQGAGKELCSPLPEQSSTSSCSGASRRHSAEYQTPGLLRLWYNTPRRLLQPQAEPPALPALGRAENQGMGGVQVQTAISRLKAQRQASMQRSHSWGSESAPSVEREGTPTPLQVFGVNQGCQGWSDYITAEQLRSVRSRHSTQVTSSPPADLAPCRTAATLEPPLCVEGSFGEWRGQRMRMLSPPPSSPPPPPPVTSLLHRPTSASASLQSPVKAPPCAWLHAGPRWGGAGKCANVSRSLLSAEELLNMQPERQEPSSAPLSRPHGAARGGDLQKPNPPHQVPSTGHGSGS
uniref:Protein Dok-7-like n=1 Tax=Oryzias melastigma TaxID=30732 RepID=A0A3B3DXT7_ORYME